MKSKILTLLLLIIGLNILGQSVPNTTTFSLQDVVSATGGGSLSEAFSNAVSGDFDPAYNNDTYAPSGSMLRFRNYGPQGIIFVRRITMQDDDAISSIEITEDGMGIYLLYPSLLKVRKYNLSNPYDISSIGSYQELDISSIGTSSSYLGGMFLTPSQKKIILSKDLYASSRVISLHFNSENDLTSYIGYTSTDISSFYVRDVCFNPTGTLMTLAGSAVGGYVNATRVKEKSIPFDVESADASNFSTGLSQRANYVARGFEFNLNGGFYHQVLLKTNLLSYNALETFTISNFNPVGNIYLYLSQIINPPTVGSILADMCFSDDKSKAYMVWNDYSGAYRVVYIEQYNVKFN